MKYLISILVLVVFISGCASQPEEKPLETAASAEEISPAQQLPVQEEIANKVFHKDFRLIMPKGWKEIELPAATFIYLPQDGDYTDPRAESVSFVVSRLPGNGINLEELAQAGIIESKKLLPDLALTEGPVESDLGPLQGLKISFEVTIAGQKMKYVQIFAEKFGSLYTATHACPIAGCKYDPEFNSIISSLEPVEAQ